MKDLILFGAGGHCFAIVELIKSTNSYLPCLIYDDQPKQQNILSVPVAKYENEELSNKSICISIGNNRIRKIISKKLKGNYPIFIHKSAHIYKSSSIGKGSVILPNAVIDADVNIGEFCIINNNATISHNTRINDFVHIAINVAIAGGVEIGEGALIGAGAIVLPEIKIGKWVTIGAGAVVTRDIPDNCTAVGTPAKPIKFRK
ncbi:MAG: acetyltransferase [Flavobacteriaceae bacterium]|nr:acetyltransferase [Flavobacteriaceae bacterium]